MSRKIINMILVAVLALSLTSVSLAQDGSGFQPIPGGLSPDSTFTAEVIKEETAPMRAALSPESFRVVPVIVTFDGSVDVSALADATGAQVTYRFTKVFDGAAMVIAGDQVDRLASMEGVEAVYLDELMKPDTEVSPGFIGAPTVWSQLGGQENAGEGVVVGVLDTGIWPEHPSFSDPNPAGKAFAPPAVAPGSNGFGAGGPRSTCDFGDSAWNPNDAPFTCNNKLIGAYDFLDTYKAVVGLLPEEFDSARDSEGHGSHTSSTAAGNGGVDASIFGVPRGTISGIAPRAHVIMYRVCAVQGCYSSDSAAAVEQAILDQVDAINFSIGGGSSPYADIVSLAFRTAYENGVFVSASAGNSGPGADTTAHREPWTITVAASTGPRSFNTTAYIAGGGGATLELTGTSVTDGVGPAPLVIPADVQCNSPFAPGSVTGQIVICQRGITGRAQKGWNVLQGGAVGMILYNQSTTVTDLETDNHFLPAVQIQYTQGQSLLDFLAANPGATATWAAGSAVASQGDVMASFSSRGGPGQSLGISKPDITAPGVQILAGMTPMPLPPEIDPALGPAGQYFQAIAGTSMSSPHIAGSGALLKALHPDWTPGQIKSAIMTTAFGGVVKEDSITPATPFDDGSGRVDLNLAGNPGLTFDESVANYIALQNELWNSNYPSLYVPVMPGKITVQRTVHSVLSLKSVWRTSVESPADVKVSVPAQFKVNPGADYTFQISVDASQVPLGQVRHATLYLKTVFGKQNTPITVRFPITIVRRQPVVSLSKACEPAEIGLKQTTTCSITAVNNSFSDTTISLVDNLPKNLIVMPGTVTGGVMEKNRKVSFDGTLAGAEPPVVTVEPGVSPAGGYLPLSLFGIAPVAGVGDETISNFNVPAFQFAGVTNTRFGFVSDGYLVVGGGTAADVQFVNQNLPNAARPNNVLAPFWTDLNPAAGGGMRVGILTDGVNRWIVADWEDVPNYSDGLPNDFQVWIGINGVEDITFAFGDVTLGDLGFLTVGAENSFGNSGQNFYYNGIGTAPGPTVGVRVNSVPASPGETHVLSFQAKGMLPGAWTNCTELTADIFQGTNVACFSGSVTRP